MVPCIKIIAVVILSLAALIMVLVPTPGVAGREEVGAGTASTTRERPVAGANPLRADKRGADAAPVRHIRGGAPPHGGPAPTASAPPAASGPAATPEPRTPPVAASGRPRVTVAAVLATAELPADPSLGLPARHIRVERWADWSVPVRIAVTADGGETLATADGLLVRAATGADRPAIERAALLAGAAGVRPVGHGGLHLVALDPLDAAGYDRVRRRLKADPAIAYAEPDWLLWGAGVPDDSDFGQQWHLHNTGQSGGTVDADIDAPAAWDITTGHSDVVVGVVDSGIDRSHPDLAPNIWINPGESGLDRFGADKATNGLDDDGNGYVDDTWGWDFAYDDNDPSDYHGHGTHVAGILGSAGDDGVGIAGTCWHARMASLRFLADNGYGQTSNAVRAIDYARTAGLDLTCNSWLGGAYSEALRDAIAAAGDAGQLFVNAAGNDGRDIDSYIPMVYPARYGLPEMIVVAATDHDDQLAGFSNEGDVYVDLAAPGDQIYSTLMGGWYGLRYGTSMACPQVAGAAALIRSIRPDLSAAEIKDAILGAVDPLPGLAGKVDTGGRLNLHACLAPLSIPYAHATGVRFHEDGSHGSSGDGDGLLERGELIAITYTARNLGPTALSGLTATATTADAHLTVVEAGGSIGDLAARSATAGPTVLVRVSNSTPLPHDAQLTLTLEDGSGATWSQPLDLRVTRMLTAGGRVSTLTGNLSIPGAEVTITGPRNATAITGADGRWSVELSAGTYTIAVSHDDWLGVELERTLTWHDSGIDVELGRPVLSIEPAVISDRLTWPARSAHTVTVTNDGDLPLVFRPSSSDWSTDGQRVWYASDVHAIPHAWENISAIGEHLVEPSTQDDGSERIEFPFYADLPNPYLWGGAYVHADGMLASFGGPPGDNTALADYPYTAAAPFWDDLDPSIAGDVFYHATPERVIVQWDGVADKHGGTHTFQAVVFPNGALEFRYHELGPTVDSCTVGMVDHGRAFEVLRDQPRLADGLTLRMVRRPWGWLSVAGHYQQLELAPGASAEVTVLLDSSSSSESVLDGYALLSSNDPVAEIEDEQVAVTLQVDGFPQLVDAPIGPLDFGDVVVGTGVELEIAIENRGPGSAELGFLDGPVGYRLVDAPVELRTFRTTTAELRFAPQSLGDHAGTVTLTTDDPDLPTIEIAVTGRGIAGPHAGFALGPVADSQVAGAPFELSVQAVDAYGNQTADFAGEAELEAWAGLRDARRWVRISELRVIDDVVSIEIADLGPVGCATAGWRLVTSADPEDPDASFATAWDLPERIAAGEAVVVDDDPRGGRFFGASLAHLRTSYRWYMLLDAEDAVVDLVVCGWTEDQLAGFAPVIDGLPRDVGTHWSGPGTTTSWNLHLGAPDSDSAACWSLAAPSLGRRNPGSGEPATDHIPLPVAPATIGPFVDGAWSGDVQVDHAAGFAWLRVETEGGAWGASDGFAVTGPAALVAVPESLDFGPVISGAVASLALDIANPSAVPITLSAATTDDARFALQDALPLTIQPGATLAASVRYAPTAVGDLDAATLTLVSADTPMDATVALQGSAVTGPLAQLTWIPPADQVAGQPFAATLSAADAYGNPVDPDAAAVSAWSLSAVDHPLITEFRAGYSTQVELHNTGEAPLDTAGWRLVFSGDTERADRVAETTWALPDAMAPGELLDTSAVHLRPTTRTAELYAWRPGGRAWIALIDDQLVVRDLVVLGWDDLSDLRIELDGYQVDLGAAWRGAGLPLVEETVSHQRSGGVDTDSAADWEPGGWPYDDVNPGLVLPVQRSLRLALDPEEASGFTAGGWTGDLTLDALGDAVVLRAAVGEVVGDSAPFALTGSPLAIDPAALDFGTVIPGSTATRALTLRNRGSAPLTVDAVAADLPQLGVDRSGPFTIPAFGSIPVAVSFGPVTSGAIAGEVTVSCAAHDPVDSVVAVVGEGVVGPVRSFAWAPIPSQVDGVGFTLELIAVDAYGNHVSGYDGSPQLLCTSGRSPVMLSRVHAFDGVGDGVQIANVIADAVDVTGWSVVISDSDSDIDRVNPQAWDLDGSLAAGAWDWRDGDPASERFLGLRFAWRDGYPSPHRGWAMVLDPAGTAVDAVFWGWTDQQMAGFAPRFRGRVLDPGWAWHGGAEAQDIGYGARSRVSPISGRNDWYTSGASPDIGDDRWFDDDIAVVASTTTVGPFVGGVWSGAVTLTGVEPSMRLHAADHQVFGSSEPFALVAADALRLDVGSPIRVRMSEDGDPVPFALEIGVVDPGTTPLSWRISTSPSNGTATVAGDDGSATVGFTPRADWHGDTSFVVTVDNGSASTSVLVLVEVEAVWDPPVAVDDEARFSRSYSYTYIDVLANDRTLEDGDYTLTITSPPNRGTATPTASGQILYRCDVSRYLGTDAFEYTVTDSRGHSDSALVEVAMYTRGGRVRVDPAATGANTGDTWEDAVTDLQEALAVTEQTELWLVAGTYTPGPAGDRSSTFTLPDGTVLLGGFAGTEAGRDERDPATPETILSGDLAGDDDGEPGADNAYHVVTITSRATLERIRITAGRADGADGDAVGGGILATGIWPRPSLEDVVIAGNLAQDGGAGIHHSGTNSINRLVLVGCTVEGNRCLDPEDSRGGGIAIADGTLELTDCILAANAAAFGSGLHASASTATVSATRFIDHQPVGIPAAHAAWHAGGTADYGGCIFNANHGALGAGDVADVTLHDSLVVANDGPLPTLGSWSARLRIERCTIHGNQVGADHAAVRSFGELGTSIQDSILQANLNGSGGGFAAQSVDAILDTSCVEGADALDGLYLVLDAPGFLDPADPDGPDDLWGTADDGLALAPESPCLDLGEALLAPARDVTGFPRGSPPDLGAFDRGPAGRRIIIRLFDQLLRPIPADCRLRVPMGAIYQADDGSTWFLGLPPSEHRVDVDEAPSGDG